MPPLRTSCAGPSGLSPQKPAPQPILTARAMLLPGQRRRAALVEGGEALARVRVRAMLASMNCAYSSALSTTHLADLGERLLAEPDAARRFAGDAVEQPGEPGVEFGRRAPRRLTNPRAAASAAGDRLAGHAELHHRAIGHDPQQIGQDHHREQADVTSGTPSSASSRATTRSQAQTRPKPPASAWPLSARDQRQPAGVHAPQQRDDIMAGIGGVERERRSVGARLQVAARAKGLVAGAGEHDGADPAVGLGGVETGDDSLATASLSALRRSGAIDRERANGAFASRRNGFGHARRLLRAVTIRHWPGVAA